MVSATPVLSRLRMLKDPDELERLRRAAGSLTSAWGPRSTQSVTGDRSIWSLPGRVRDAPSGRGRLGRPDPCRFRVALGDGARSGPAPGNPIVSGDVVQIHAAPIVDGYTVGPCRTVFVGDVPVEARDALEAYLQAQAAGIAVATPGSPLLGIDAAMTEAQRPRPPGTPSCGPGSTGSAPNTRRWRFPLVTLSCMAKNRPTRSRPA